MKKIAAIAVQTFRGHARDRVFHSALLFSVLFVFFAYFLSTLTIVESRKILLDFGFSAISIMGTVVAIFIGTATIGKEIEKRTIYTVLSKPVSRSEYVLGKYLGSTAALVGIYLLNGATLALILFHLEEGFPQGFIDSLYLMALESLLVMALALFFSLYFSSVFLAASLAFAVFLVGRSNHSLRMIHDKIVLEPLRFLLRALYNVVPSLDRYNIRELVAYSKPYPAGMLELSTLYFFVYSLLLLSLCLLLIRRKDFT